MNIVPPPEKRPVWQTSVHFFTLVLILVFANWGAPASSDTGLWSSIFTYKWYITGALALLLCWSLVRILKLRLLWVMLGAVVTAISAFLAHLFIGDSKLVPLVPMLVAIAALSVILLSDKREEENREWVFASWGFAKQILPLLAVGVVAAGFLLGSTHDDTVIAGIIPNSWIEWAVGGNSLLSNFFASCPGIAGFGHGERSRFGFAVGRTVVVPPEHAGHPRCFGHEENSRLCRTRNCHGDNFRLCVWESIMTWGLRR